MSVKEQIQNDVKTAMREKDNFKRDTLRTILSVFKQIEVDERVLIDDTRAFSIIQSEIKKRKDSIEQYLKGDRKDLADKEQSEIDVIISYLPRQLSKDELEAKLAEIITKTNATSIKDLGKVMKVAKEEIGSSSDGKNISECAKKLLSNQGQ
ncbi:GatB/YqeY family protein [Campylobacter blaseri]|uniref:Glutamyl-tRNA amidotransferase n=1 Tax=Campylobacter blaseri TaxID=2042961 RepID=A0A2P8R0B5_9BACT|nr:GatB/YqeY domain-containing protein [Campylobacter blaseri]PSM51929.1 glutamyl-tRNA amidotransferase [Campylobacter blaseri]PSM53713.1 glutamyl-tRNA amidotransferase [Campylobacter blaseri]QKF85733.1 GatB/YqeY family protein [Campylobacter blaseri]